MPFICMSAQLSGDSKLSGVSQCSQTTNLRGHEPYTASHRCFSPSSVRHIEVKHIRCPSLTLNNRQQYSQQPESLLQSVYDQCRAWRLAQVLWLCSAGVPAPTNAAEIGISASGLGAWLDTLEALGPSGPLALAGVVAAAEMIPFSPTQPLSLAAGLAFGAVKGGVCVMIGVTTAGLMAFTLARSVGKPWASKLAEQELGQHAASNKQVVQASLAQVQAAIEQGSFWQQCTAVTLLRLTPIVPFSASNYVLGLTPLRYGPFLLGTVAGMSVWSAVYASLGAAGRVLLQQRQASLDDVIAGMTASAAAVGGNFAVLAIVLGLMAAAASWAIGLIRPKSS